jgi:hypothetical protein
MNVNGSFKAPNWRHRKREREINKERERQRQRGEIVGMAKGRDNRKREGERYQKEVFFCKLHTS